MLMHFIGTFVPMTLSTSGNTRPSSKTNCGSCAFCISRF
jgi:hypothetical protein